MRCEMWMWIVISGEVRCGTCMIMMHEIRRVRRPVLVFALNQEAEEV